MAAKVWCSFFMEHPEVNSCRIAILIKHYILLSLPCLLRKKNRLISLQIFFNQKEIVGERSCSTATRNNKFRPFA